ncbi:MAG: hypothetical protein MJ078_05135, partial [Clostridia bacterium]|nr:hypothetical protein [Clostridia bacterium]
MDILLNIGKYFGYVFWGFVVLGALLALGRGTVKNVLKLIVVALSALGTYFVSGIIGDLSLSIPVFLDAVNGFLSQIPATYIPGDALYVIIKFMVAVLVSPIAFLLLYLVLSLIFLLVYAILGGKKKDKKGLLSKLSGIVMGAVAGAVTCLTFLSPVWA